MKYFAKNIDGKLFLCSRDIKVGDAIKCLHNNTEGIITSIKKQTNKKLDKNNQPTQRVVRYGKRYFTVESQVFKVIGLISPEATWVKEGDQFDEKGIEIIHFRGETAWPIIGGSSYEVFKDDFDDWRIGVYIKGPCGHFH